MWVSVGPTVTEALTMPIIDSQVYAYAANTAERRWATVPNWSEHVIGEEMVTAMDKVGVDGAIAGVRALEVPLRRERRRRRA